MLCKSTYTFLFVVLAALCLQAQDAELIFDGSSSAAPFLMKELTATNGKIYFSGRHQGIEAQSQLYQLNENGVGIHTVKKIEATPAQNPIGGNPDHLTSVDKLLFFNQYESGNRIMKIWVTDGTEAGTHAVVSASTDDYQAMTKGVAFKNQLFYFTENGSKGCRIWRTDGTDAATFLIKDFGPGSNGSYPSNLMVAGNNLYFYLNDQLHGNELWKTDGTSQGTYLVKDINPGAASSLPAVIWELSFASSNGNLYFAANDGVHGTELWTSDGTEAGTAMVTDINPGTEESYPLNFITGNGIVYFSAAASSYTILQNSRIETHFNTKLYRTDGTASGTHAVKNINDNGQHGSDVTCLMFSDDQLFFVAIDNLRKYCFFLSDGTSEGTHQVVFDPKTVQIGSPYGFLNAKNTVYFYSLKDFSFDVWRSNGRIGGTFNLCKTRQDWYKPSYPILLAKDGLYFTSDYGQKLWRVKDVNLASVNGKSFVAFPNPFESSFAVYFSEDIAAGECDLSIYDYLGKNVYHETFHTIDQVYVNTLHNLVPGIYMLTLKYGDKSYSQKMVKSN